MGYMCSVEIALVLVLIQRVLITDMDYEFEGDKFISPLLSDHLQVVQNMPEHQVVETSLRCLLKARPIGWFRNIYGRGTTFCVSSAYYAPPNVTQVRGHIQRWVCFSI